MQAQGSVRHLRWSQAAACLDADPGLFFPGPTQSAAPALQICAKCAVEEHCLQYALAIDEPYGIWGGMTASRRRRLLSRGA